MIAPARAGIGGQDSQRRTLLLPLAHETDIALRSAGRAQQHGARERAQ
jgi:hypothetical protein